MKAVAHNTGSAPGQNRENQILRDFGVGIAGTEWGNTEFDTTRGVGENMRKDRIMMGVDPEIGSAHNVNNMMNVVKTGLGFGNKEFGAARMES